MAKNLLLVGFLSILAQVVLLRELNVAMYGIELIYILALGWWLLWTSIGAYTGSRWPARISPDTAEFPFLFFPLILLPSIIFVRGNHILFGGVPGAFLPFLHQVLIVAISMLPVGITVGLMFQWLARIYVKSGKRFTIAYAIECAGGTIGGLASTLFLVLKIQNITIGLICCVTALTAIRIKTSKSGKIIAAVILVGLAVVIFFNSSLDISMTRWNHPDLVTSSDTPYGRIDIIKTGEQLSVYENNTLSYESGGTEAEELVYLSLVQHPNPGKILVLGGGFAGIINELYEYGSALEKDKRITIDYVELNRELLNLVDQHLPILSQGNNSNYEVNIVQDDPRKFIRAENFSDKYDLIIMALPDPYSGQTNRYYTREFFEYCSNRIDDNGILVFRLKSAENYWTPPIERKMSSIYKALELVFPDVIVLPGASNIFISSRNILEHDPQVLGERFNNLSVETQLVTSRLIEYLYTNDRYYTIERILETSGTQPNSDLHPVCYKNALIIWLSKFYPKLSFINHQSEMDNVTSENTGQLDKTRIVPFVVLAVILIVNIIVRRYKRIKYLALVAFAGFFSMVLETILILNYQVREGVLFQDMGILLMMFMAGLSFSAAVFDRLLEKSGLQNSIIIGIGIQTIAVLFPLLVILILTGEQGTGLIITSLLMFFTGTITAMIFTYSVSRHSPGERAAETALYAADVTGGCGGAVAAGLVLVPFYGLVDSSIFMAAMACTYFLVI